MITSKKMMEADDRFRDKVIMVAPFREDATYGRRKAIV